MNFLLGEKIEMRQQFDTDGNVIPVTVMRAGPCTVRQVKMAEKDGTNAVQVGFGQRKKQSKASQGHLKDLSSFATLREFRVKNPSEYQRGKVLTVELFTVGEKVLVRSKSKGKGFQGVVKRHGFHGSPATHGHKDQLRMPGSIGATDKQNVMKGMRMAGRMGATQVTVRNLKVISVDPEKHLLTVNGSIPGARHTTVIIESIS